MWLCALGTSTDSRGRSRGGQASKCATGTSEEGQIQADLAAHCTGDCYRRTPSGEKTLGTGASPARYQAHSLPILELLLT